MEDGAAVLHGVLIGACLKQVRLEEFERARGLVGNLGQVGEFCGGLRVAHGGVDRHACLQQLLDQPAGHIAGCAVTRTGASVEISMIVLLLSLRRHGPPHSDTGLGHPVNALVVVSDT